VIFKNDGGRETLLKNCRDVLERIEEIDRKGPHLNAVLELNPDAAALPHAWMMKERKEIPRSNACIRC